MAVVYLALPYLDKRRLHSMALPNPGNFAFHYPSFCRVRLRLALAPPCHQKAQCTCDGNERGLPTLARHAWMRLVACGLHPMPS